MGVLGWVVGERPPRWGVPNHDCVHIMTKINMPRGPSIGAECNEQTVWGETYTRSLYGPLSPSGDATRGDTTIVMQWHTRDVCRSTLREVPSAPCGAAEMLIRPGSTQAKHTYICLDMQGRWGSERVPKALPSAVQISIRLSLCSQRTREMCVRAHWRGRHHVLLPRCSEAKLKYIS